VLLERARTGRQEADGQRHDEGRATEQGADDVAHHLFHLAKSRNAPFEQRLRHALSVAWIGCALDSLFLSPDRICNRALHALAEVRGPELEEHVTHLVEGQGKLPRITDQ